MVTTDQLDRKLAAILYADVVGYSRLTGEDEEGTHRLVRAYLGLVSEFIENHNGTVVNHAGDAVLADFTTVTNALRSAVAIQNELKARNEGVADDRKVQFRIGVNLGEVIVDQGDIYGDGVNIAARLESLAMPGGICISESVRSTVGNKLSLEYEDLGEQQVKNIAEPVHVYRIKPDGGEQRSEAQASDSANDQQQIRFCTSADGVRIAYATVGHGEPIVKTANWLNHLEYDWESPVWKPLLDELIKDHRLIRYDARGNGLSDWEVADISFEAFVSDLEAVVDSAGVERFALFGVSQGCAVAIAYAARYPERVSGLVLYGGYARGVRRRGSQEESKERDALYTLMRVGWGQDNPAFRQIFTSQLIPGGTPEQIMWLNDLQRITTSPENAVRIRQALDEIDISGHLADVTVPTLVLHCRDDVTVPFEEGRRLAAMIPGARFVALESRNHLILHGEPAWFRLLEEMKNFFDTI
jgi:class 3 adenylate cyclase/pimeloyl-ACP methyl ester carboxylesterase